MVRGQQTSLVLSLSMRAKQAAPRSRRRLGLFGLVLFAGIFLVLRAATGGHEEYDPAKEFPSNNADVSAGIHASIIIPAYHERDNIRPLVTRTFAALKHPHSTEIVIVDDNSRDGTIEEVDTIQKEGFNVVLITRVGEKGLSSAVLRGMRDSRGESLVVMDADLQVSYSTVTCNLHSDCISSAAPTRSCSRSIRRPRKPKDAIRVGNTLRSWGIHGRELAIIPSRNILGCTLSRSSPHHRK